MDHNTELRGESTSSSKMNVLERPTDLPGSCACCGATQRPVVDFGVSVETENFGYGVLYLCQDCCIQAASKFVEIAPVIRAPELNENDFNRLKDGLDHAVRNVVVNWAEHLVVIVPPQLPNLVTVEESAEPSPEPAKPEGRKSRAAKTSNGTDEASGSEGPIRVPSFEL